MRAPHTIALLLLMVPASWAAGTPTKADPAPQQRVQIPSADADAGEDVPQDQASPDSPLPPDQRAQACTAEMARIAQRFSETLAKVTEAVDRGELSREQGKDISIAQYEQAEMQFELLAALRALDEQSAPSSAPTDPDPDQGAALTVALPFSSVQLSPQLVAYLGLTQSQIETIEKVLARENADLQPLMDQLRATRAQLLKATQQEMSGKKIDALAATEAGLLRRLGTASARTQTDIRKILSKQQQGKLEEFKRDSQSRPAHEDSPASTLTVSDQ